MFTLKHITLGFGLFLLSVFNQSLAQTIEIPNEVNWLHRQANKIADPDGNVLAIEVGKVENSSVSIVHNYRLPFVSLKLESPDFEVEELSIIVEDKTEVKFSNDVIDQIRSKHPLTFYHTTERKQRFAHLLTMPYIVEGNRVYQINSFRWVISKRRIKSRHSFAKKSDEVTTSALANGVWHKWSVTKSGIHVLNFDAIQAMGLGTVSFSALRIYSNGGAMVPEVINDSRVRDIQELPCLTVDENNNNVFDEGDQLFFYMEGPDVWLYDSTSKSYEYQKHTYSNTSHFFVTVKEGAKRMNTLPSGDGASVDLSVNTFDYLQAHEQDLESLIETGREWYGEEITSDKPFNLIVALPEDPVDNKVIVDAQYITRGLELSFVNTTLNGIDLGTTSFGQISGKYTDAFASGPTRKQYSPNVTAKSLEIVSSIQSNDPSAISWVDFIHVEAHLPLNYAGGQLPISSKTAAIDGRVEYVVSGNPNWIFDITNLHETSIQSTAAQENNHTFNALHNNKIRRYIALNPNAAFAPAYIGEIENQNLHGIATSDYLIITNKLFLSQANQLAEFHRNSNGLKVDVVIVDQVYNEFSSGTQDVTAIRDFVKMVYDRGHVGSDLLKGVLLFGDASYDFKNTVKGNTNFVPIYQSFNSHVPTRSHCSDDYYVILDDDEGNWGLKGSKEGLDLGVGRIPASSVEEANAIVNKIINYNTTKTFGDWRNEAIFIGDDEDSNGHLADVEAITGFVIKDVKDVNVKKIYLDAYEQTSFGSGDKYPQVNEAIDRELESGVLVMNYIGHGGGQGMAHERIVTRTQIRNWKNTRHPLMITATCELARFDDPLQDSPGELALFNKIGGAVALISTTRVVYTSANANLNEQLIDRNLFEKRSGHWPNLGDIYFKTKNESFVDHINQRNFILLGDPLLTLAYPEFNVHTTKINGVPIGSGNDTLKALSKVRIEGEITDDDSVLLSQFNGIVYPTVFDKFLEQKTLANDPESFEITYLEQSSVLYRGAATVTNGKFSFEFVMPKDIAYQVGAGKISYYANNNESDANGYENRFAVGQTAEQVAVDNIGPDIELWLEDTTFVDGGLVSSTPLLIARFYDENGINTVGSGIGREIEAIIDKNTEHEQRIVLNDFYSATLDDFRRGEVQFELNELPSGLHTVHLKGWDVYNNSSTESTNFEIQSNEDLNIENVLNYPNPFTTNTEFHFDHNRPGEELSVALNVMTITGKVVKSFQQVLPSADNHFVGFQWNGLDQYGDKLARGTYLYKIEVKTADGSTANTYQKLFLIR